MITKDEALQIVWEYVKREGWDVKNPPQNAYLFTRKSLEGARAQELRQRRPDAWKLLESTFREHWCITFETGLRSPPFTIVNVDAETGEVTVPWVL